MNQLIQRAASLSPLGKLVCAALGILLIHSTFRLLERRLPQHFRERDVRYRVRKFVVFAGYIAGVVFMTILFEDRLGQVSFALGVAGAGLVVALQDLIASIAGWFAIAWSNLYRVGDRVQIGDTRGDVIDVSFMRTTLVETGNWVNNDLYNGRVVRIPNSVALKGNVFNYSQGFRFVWDEIRISLTPESDHVMAKQMLLRIANEAVLSYIEEAERFWKTITENFRIENVSLMPTVNLNVKNGYLELTLNYIVQYTNRTAMQDRLFSSAVDEINRSQGRLSWASSTGSAPDRSPNPQATQVGQAVDSAASIIAVR
jgi:small-conductance mechanosensitive channel